MGITRPRLRFPSPALVIACLALFVALGGSTYAAVRAAGGGSSVKDAKLLSDQVRLAAGNSSVVINVPRFAEITGACPADSNATTSLLFHNTSGRNLTPAQCMCARTRTRPESGWQRARPERRPETGLRRPSRTSPPETGGGRVRDGRREPTGDPT